ncbi:hypothetical protein O3M35_007190 [Rhynocoris fuscipes]|uniref:Uncharacterized protein n=1 Tax=Rhynocoris fuscipes TaxID=488301 RepID=A0AAW1DAY5_9HEMI
MSDRNKEKNCGSNIDPEQLDSPKIKNEKHFIELFKERMNLLADCIDKATEKLGAEAEKSNANQKHILEKLRYNLKKQSEYLKQGANKDSSANNMKKVFEDVALLITLDLNAASNELNKVLNDNNKLDLMIEE